MIAATFLQKKTNERKISGLSLSIIKLKEKNAKMYTLSLLLLRLTITAVICWSMKIRIVARNAGGIAAKLSHHLSGLRAIGFMNQPRSGIVGF